MSSHTGEGTSKFGELVSLCKELRWLWGSLYDKARIRVLRSLEYPISGCVSLLLQLDGHGWTQKIYQGTLMC